MANSGIVTIFIMLLLVTSITLLALKQNFGALATSAGVSMLVIFALIPKEMPKNVTYTYLPSGGARVVGKPVSVPPPLPRMVRRARGNLGTSLPERTTSLPLCTPPPEAPTDKEMRNYIRTNGMYGIHGNLDCRKMQRSSVADKGLIQPLSARNQLLQFLAVDQLHSKDSSMISRQSRKIS